MNEIDRIRRRLSLADRAAEFAARKHRNQRRKSSDVPYIIHPFAVCLILSRLHCDQEILAAALLHDTLEDTDTTVAELRDHFSERVVTIVQGCSEPVKSRPWEERKQHTIDSLRSAPLDVRLVVAADKLHNARSIGEELEELGGEVWKRFNRARAQQEWYYRNILESLRAGDGDERLESIITELAAEVNYLFDSDR